jgi:lipopolysaccharide transport system ATP-binding protein
VGDINFQKKCLGKMGDVARQGRTVVLVSHQMNQMRRLCHRAVWIDGGKVRMNGATHEVVSAYESAMTGAQLGRQERGSGAHGQFLRWEIAGSERDESNVLTTLGPVTVQFTVRITKPVRKGHHGCALFTHDRQLVWAWATDQIRLEPGEHHLRYTFPMLPLKPGPYGWQVSIYEDGEQLDAWECVPEMIVATELHQHASDDWNGILNMPSQFEVAARGEGDS